MSMNSIKSIVNAAKAKARKQGKTLFIVENEEGFYDIATAADMDTFYADYEAIAAIEPDGNLDM